MEEAGGGEWGENVRVRSLRIYFILLLFLMHILEPMCQRKTFIIMLWILMNNNF